MSADPLTYPNSPVLINKLNITDFDRMRKIEYAIANARLRELKAKPIEGKFDLDHLKQIHHYLLRDIYDWAGKTRDEVYEKDRLFSKGSTLFALQSELKQNAILLFDKLTRDNHLKGLENDKNGFVKKLTELYVGMNNLHPFREGNGRSTQEFIYQLSRQAGYEIDYSKVDKQRWNASARDSAQGDPSKILSVFQDIASPEKAVAFDRLEPGQALKRHPELENAYRLLFTAKAFANEKFQTSQERIRFVHTTREKISAQLHQGKEITLSQVQEAQKNMHRDQMER